MPQPDPALVAETLALVQAQAQIREQINQAAQAAAAAEVRAFGGWYDSTQITGFAGRLAKLTRARQKQLALSTDSFATRILAALLGKRPPAVGAIPVDGLRGGVPLESVYGRLADEYRWLYATRGPQSTPEMRVSPDTGQELPILTPDDVLDRIVTRAEIQAEDNLSLAFREQWVSDLAPAGPVVGYRRVLHPELSRGGSCGLCIAASDHRYYKKALMPLHSRCNCGVAAITGELLGPGDPGSAINQEDLAALYKAAGGSTAGRELKKARFKVIDHEELGPRLVYAGHHSRSQADIAADRRGVTRREPAAPAA